ncbi:hypothetical protein KEJ34_04300 [Candidatus Bathyarchaeota archaeon]|nr:hypothetical protein [Candidatus Bathyarchaeota archaeon]
MSLVLEKRVNPFKFPSAFMMGFSSNILNLSIPLFSACKAQNFKRAYLTHATACAGFIASLCRSR